MIWAICGLGQNNALLVHVQGFGAMVCLSFEGQVGLTVKSRGLSTASGLELRV